MRWSADYACDQPLKECLDSFSTKFGRIAACLREWKALHDTGHFIDLHPEMRERVDSASERTSEALFALDRP